MSVKIYINGKETPKEELKHIEIHNEEVKKILAGKLHEIEKQKTDRKDGQEGDNSETKHSIP